ncbi:MAG: hypothetical protein D6798_19910, partial [Deltaproteobacteria bacterium]
QNWVDSGLATVRDGRIAIPPETLQRLRTLSTLPLAPLADAPIPGDGRTRQVSRAIAIAGDRARRPMLSAALGMPLAELDAIIARLSHGGAVHADDTGLLVDDTAGATLADIPPGERIDIHGRIAAALPPSDPTRLSHLLAAGAPAATIVDAATTTAEEHHQQGRLTDTLAVAELAFQVIRAEPYAIGRATRLIDLYTCAAIATDLPPTLARAAWELRRLPRLPQLDGRAALIDASRAALSGRPDEALELVAAMPETGDPELDRMVATVMFQASRSLPVEAEEFLLERIAERLGEPRDRASEALLAGWLGHLRYRQGRFEESAQLHARSQRGPGTLHRRVAAALDRATALLAAGQTDAAEVQALQARLLAEEYRDPSLEARAWALARRVARLRGRAGGPDTDLVATVHGLGSPSLSAEVALNEALVARDTGYLQDAADLAMQARAAFHAAGKRALAVLAASLAADSGEARGLWWARQHFEEVAADGEVEILLQAAALLTRATGAEDWAARGRQVARRLGAVDLACPREVMPLAEALHALGG